MSDGRGGYSRSKVQSSQVGVGQLMVKLATMIRVGKVTEVDYGNAKAKVKISDKITTDPIPWATTKAAGDNIWNPPAVGEQVIILSPNGSLDNAVIAFSLNQTSFPAVGNSLEKKIINWADGSAFSFDIGASELLLSIGGNTEIKANANEFKVTVGATTFLITENEVTITIGDTVMSWANSGTTLATPSYSATQS